jgi:hypothetical protein
LPALMQGHGLLQLLDERESLRRNAGGRTLEPARRRGFGHCCVERLKAGGPS